VITRKTGYLTISRRPSPEAADELQREGFVMLRQVFSGDQLKALTEDIERVYDEYPPDERSGAYELDHWEPFRYEMFNRSAAVHEAIAHPAILEVVDALLAEDCHVIANTAWRQGPGNNDHGGRRWHIDSGPHIPRPAGVPWDERIPYPVFAIAAHIYLWDCPIESGPTAVLRGSHTSGQHPPLDRMEDDNLEWNGENAVPLVADAGDVALFVSDTWHRRLPSKEGDPGRFFLQCHYGRRDLAQRVQPTTVANQVSSEAEARAVTTRQRNLIGLHRPFFYDG
jgi:ectoine hydroxylase-related dioxygenase (phytanoyl-CoA dioxygenase family)